MDYPLVESGTVRINLELLRNFVQEMTTLWTTGGEWMFATVLFCTVVAFLQS